MQIPGRLAGLLLAGWVCAGCAAEGVAFRSAEPGRRYSCPGLSVLPPPGDDWLVFPADAIPAGPVPPGGVCHIVFGKLPRGKPERAEDAISYVAMGNSLDLRGKGLPRRPEEFRRFMEQGIGRSLGPRYRLLNSSFTLDYSPGAVCVRYSASVEDRGVPAFPRAVFIITAQGFHCLHPGARGIVIHVGYNQRHLQGQAPLPLAKEGELFLRSLRFDPWHQAPFAGLGPQPPSKRAARPTPSQTKSPRRPEPAGASMRFPAATHSPTKKIAVP